MPSEYLSGKGWSSCFAAVSRGEPVCSAREGSLQAGHAATAHVHHAPPLLHCSRSDLRPNLEEWPPRTSETALIRRASGGYSSNAAGLARLLHEERSIGPLRGKFRDVESMSAEPTEEDGRRPLLQPWQIGCPAIGRNARGRAVSSLETQGSNRELLRDD